MHLMKTFGIPALHTALLVGALCLGADAAQAATGGHGSGEPHINWWARDMHAPPVGWFILNFLLFVWLMVRFLKKPVRAAMVSRHDTIRTTIERNAVARDRAREHHAEAKGKLDNVDQEGREILASIKEMAGDERARLLAAAEEYSARLRKDAGSIADQELRRATERLHADTVRAALTRAEALVEQGITEADKKRLVEESIAALEESELEAKPQRTVRARQAVGDVA